MNFLPALDLAALAYFVVAWIGYAVAVEWGQQHHGGLNARMHRYREVWMRRTLARELRMVDMQIMAALQNGTAFFASTTLIAIGGALTIMRATGEVLTVVATLPFGIVTTPAQWEAKTIGLIVIFIYAFFKFAWSYRLFNYVAIMLGAMPFASEKNTPEAERHVLRTTRLFESAGQNFNRGQRAFFFALGYLGWFAGPWVLFASTTAVVIVMWRRQFASSAQRALIIEPQGQAPAQMQPQVTAQETAPSSAP
ncbi:MAG TPA: DUF599 domain-containing protein [Xanthobacteraceae bacterium]|nr:DUF599 domain-containing protein [Xanthobacteraceae bacterium]